MLLQNSLKDSSQRSSFEGLLFVAKEVLSIKFCSETNGTEVVGLYLLLCSVLERGEWTQGCRGARRGVQTTAGTTSALRSNSSSNELDSRTLSLGERSAHPTSQQRSHSAHATSRTRKSFLSSSPRRSDADMALPPPTASSGAAAASSGADCDVNLRRGAKQSQGDVAVSMVAKFQKILEILLLKVRHFFSLPLQSTPHTTKHEIRINLPLFLHLLLQSTFVLSCRMAWV